LRTAYGSTVGTVTIANELNNALEEGLLSVVDSRLGKNMGRLGHLHAIVNGIPQHEGVAGDTSTYGMYGIVVQHSPELDGNRVSAEVAGRHALQRKPDVSRLYTERGGTIDIPHGISQRDPAARKAAKTYYSSVTKEHQVYQGPLGSGLQRQTAVLPIQMTDADLLKLMIIRVNKDLDIPLPLATVHDAIITPMDTMHIYRNAYNNIAIPMAIPGIKLFAQRMLNSYGAQREMALKRAEELSSYATTDYQTGEKIPGVIGIGANGDFPVMGAVFDDLNEKISSESYRSIFKTKKNSKTTGDQDYQRWRLQAETVLKQARDNGWVANQPSIAVSYEQFKELLRLLESLDGVESISKDGDKYTATGKLGNFVRSFSTNVEQGWSQLTANNFIAKEGLNQMSPAGAANNPRRGYTKDTEWQAKKRVAEDIRNKKMQEHYAEQAKREAEIRAERAKKAKPALSEVPEGEMPF